MWYITTTKTGLESDPFFGKGFIHMASIMASPGLSVSGEIWIFNGGHTAYRRRVQTSYHVDPQTRMHEDICDLCDSREQGHAVCRSGTIDYTSRRLLHKVQLHSSAP
jgi:hypothetical protein